MRPPILGIGGAHSGVGKTAVACEILRRFTGWGAIKYTGTSLYSCIIDDISVLSEAGRDTKQFLDAGAEKVLLVKAPLSVLPEVMPMAVAMLTHLKGILIEGNSAIHVMQPDIVLFVSGDESGYKSGAAEVLSMTDIVLFQEAPPKKAAGDIPVFHRYDIDGYVKEILRKIRE